MKHMKSTIAVLAIASLAGFALVGCNQNAPVNSTDAQSTNSSASDASGISTNMPATNSLPDINTNTPATNSLPITQTNVVAINNK
jgi:uncharacterized protein YcfL